jgi:hypothetical protein
MTTRRMSGPASALARAEAQVAEVRDEPAARLALMGRVFHGPTGSVWWRAVNERLLRDGCETVALLGGLAGTPSSQPVGSTTP